MTDAQIIKYCKKGDPKGFKYFVDAYSSMLYGICIRYMNDEFEAKDVLQDSLIKIFNAIKNYKNTGSFEGWISKITVNTALMALRKNKKLIMFLEPVNDYENIAIGEIEGELNERDILDMLEKMPDHYRVIFNLAIVEGYKHSEIAKILEIPESTSRTKLTRARQKMKKIYLEEMKVKSINIERKYK